MRAIHLKSQWQRSQQRNAGGHGHAVGGGPPVGRARIGVATTTVSAAPYVGSRRLYQRGGLRVPATAVPGGSFSLSSSRRRFSLFAATASVARRGTAVSTDFDASKRAPSSPIRAMAAKLLDKLRVILPHVVLITVMVLYSLIGATIFHNIERPFEVQHLMRHARAVTEAEDLLMEIELDPLNVNETNEAIEFAIDNLIRTAMEAFEEGLKPSDLHATHENNTRSKWTYHSALFFTATVLTSIGYGNLVPISFYGRLFCICYAIMGIPLTLITIADVAKFFSDLIVKAERRWKRRKENPDGSARSSKQIKNTEENDDEEDEDDEDILAEAGFWAKMFVLMLLLLYMVACAFVFSHIQNNWNFLDSFYFNLITLTTIGFGDLSPAEEDHYLGWILFIFLGLIITTLTVDMVGSTFISNMHSWGRGIDALALFSALGKAGQDEAGAWAFVPRDIHLFPYIDENLRRNYENNVIKHLSIASFSQ